MNKIKKISLLNIFKNDLFYQDYNNFDILDTEIKNQICQLADDFNIGRLFYYYHKDFLPSDWKKEFANEFRLTSAMELRRTNDLKIILKIFENNNIKAALLKGNYVAHTAYPHPGLRTMCDIDILIEENQIEKAYQLLIDSGFRQTSEIKHAYHKPGLRSKNGTFIELHYHITHNKSNIKTEMLWNGCKKNNILGIETYFLTPEVIILHTIMHAFRDLMLSGFKPFIDVAYLIKKFNPSPEGLKCKAKEFGLLDQLRLFFNIYTDFFPETYRIEPEKNDYDLLEKIRYLTENFEIHQKTNNQERGFENSFAGNSIKEKILFIYNAVFKGRNVIAYKYKVKNKFPGIYYWYMISILDGFKLFLKYLFKKEKDSTKKQIGYYQRDLSAFLKNNFS